MTANWFRRRVRLFRQRRQTPIGLTHPAFYLVLTDQPGKDSWPITGASFILMHKEQANPDRTKIALTFFSWCYANGAKMAEELDYIAIPKNVVKIVKSVWSNDIKAKDGKVIFPTK